MSKFYTAKYDRVFKSIFCREENYHLMKEFLSRILQTKVEQLSILNNELSVGNVLEKKKSVDILVKVEKNIFISS